MERLDRAFLCQVCTRMVARINKDIHDNSASSCSGSHHKNFVDLSVAAAQSCGICTRLRNRVLKNSDCYRTYWQSSDEDFWLNYNFTIGPWGQLSFGAKETTTDTSSLRSLEEFTAVLNLQPLSSSKLQCYEISCPQTDYTGDAQVLAQARTWLASCDTEHKSCFKSSDQSYQPPRLLRILEKSVQLLETELASVRKRYVTLSYCWGRSPKHLVLTADNISKFRDGIGLDHLARTFQDSITASRQLGFEYIWIDALCIVQDGHGHEADWRRHVVEMSSIYTNCDLNIAVDHGESAESGCFVQRNPKDLQLCILDLPSLPHPQGSEQDASTDVTDSEETKFLINEDIEIDNLILSEPLYERAWVFQERLLSPRILHFGRQQIGWECSEMHCSESLPHGPIEISISQTIPFSLEMTFPRAWYGVVGSYTKASLTNRRDRLPALAGIAKRICENRSDTYIAGLLREDLPDCLLWRCAASSQGNIVEPYRAPTWSWASRDVSVGFGRPSSWEYFVELVHIEMQLVDENNPFGEIKNGSVKLSAPLYHAPMSAHQLDEFGNATLACCRRSDGPDTLGITISVGYDVPISLRKTAVEMNLLFFKHDTLSIEGMLVEPTNETSERTWQRVGTFTAYAFENDTEKWSVAMEQLENCPTCTLKLV